MNSRRAHAHLCRALVNAHESHRAHLGEHPWEWEHARWEEFLVCLLIEGAEVEPQLARGCVFALRGLGLTAIQPLAKADQGTREILRRVLLHLGTHPHAASRSVDLMTCAAGAVRKKWNGHIHRFLRAHGLVMVQELAGSLKGKHWSRGVATKVATLWLQNVASLPILVSGSPHVSNFCSRMHVSEKTLVDTADGMGLNVALLDDLIAETDRCEEETRLHSRRTGKRHTTKVR